MSENNSMLRLNKFVLTLACSIQITSAMAVESKGESFYKVITSTSKGSELQLDARSASLPKILDYLSKKTRIPIHYSVLPEGLVSATCVGSSIKPVLECLLAHKADLAFRAPEKPANENDVSEVWITGTSLAGNDGKSAGCTGRAEKAEQELQALKQKLEAQDGTPDMTDEFLRMSESKKPGDRVAAIGALLGSKRKEDPAVKAVLEKALNDQNAAVRAQAVSTVGQSGGDDAVAVLQDALQDESVDVRLMAVSAITDNVELLQQAINDSDETVRALASIKLNEIQARRGK
jgi:hypothetical protein